MQSSFFVEEAPRAYFFPTPDLFETGYPYEGCFKKKVVELSESVMSR
jgi:hypothetical protein